MRGDDDQSVFLGIPHTRYIEAEAFNGLAQASRRGQLTWRFNRFSLLTLNFNSIWCDALNARAKSKLTHFAMHHSDIVVLKPEFWVDVVIDEMDRVGADIMSVAIALKDDRRLTTTAVAKGRNCIRRLSLHELHQLPETFSVKDVTRDADTRLLLNTGLWVCRFTEPWVEAACFHVQDAILKKPDGTFRPCCVSEDWNFSDWAAHIGLKLFATRKIVASHRGDYEWRNDVWTGGCRYDPGDDLARIDVAQAPAPAPEQPAGPVVVPPDVAAFYTDAGRKEPVLKSREDSIAAALAIDGWLTKAEATALYDLAREADGPIVEIGSYQGRSTTAIALGAMAGHNPPVYAVDSFQGVDPRSRPTSLGAVPMLGITPEQLRKNLDSAGVNGQVRIVPKASHEAVGEIPDRCALLFVDGDHDYESVCRDLDLYLPKVAMGGRVVLHDVGEYDLDVGRAVASRIRSRPLEWRIVDHIGTAMIAERWDAAAELERTGA